jgi:hypothetical protein
VAPHANFADFGGNRYPTETQRDGITAHIRQKQRCLTVSSRHTMPLNEEWGKSRKNGVENGRIRESPSPGHQDAGSTTTPHHPHIPYKGVCGGGTSGGMVVVGQKARRRRTPAPQNALLAH